MANTLSSSYIYPPNWDGNPMQSNWNNWNKYILHLQNYSDGTAETRVAKIDISTFKTPTQKQANRMVIDKIEYQLQGMGVRLEWDRRPYIKIEDINCGSDGSERGCIEGPFVDDSEVGDATGDLLLSTLEGANLDSYDLKIHFRVKE